MNDEGIGHHGNHVFTRPGLTRCGLLLTGALCGQWTDRTTYHNKYPAAMKGKQHIILALVSSHGKTPHGHNKPSRKSRVKQNTAGRSVAGTARRTKHNNQKQRRRIKPHTVEGKTLLQPHITSYEWTMDTNALTLKMWYSQDLARGHESVEPKGVYLYWWDFFWHLLNNTH